MENGHYIEKVLSWIDFMKEFSSITKEETDQAEKDLEISRLKDVIAEITQENLEIKKPWK